MARTVTTRVSERVHQESRQYAGLLGIQSSEVLDQAWDEFFENHRETFAAQLEEAARIVRDGTTNELADYLGGADRKERAAAAAGEFSASLPNAQT